MTDALMNITQIFSITTESVNGHAPEPVQFIFPSATSLFQFCSLTVCLPTGAFEEIPPPKKLLYN